VSPSRGQQGNALKTILAMAFALDGESGETVIEAHGVLHRIVFSIDRIRRERRSRTPGRPLFVKTGTRITVKWLIQLCPELDDAKDRFYKSPTTLLAQPSFDSVARLGPADDGGRDEAGVDHIAASPGVDQVATVGPTCPHWYGAPISKG